MSEKDLFDLLSQCRKNNLLYDITGLLLYMEGRFISRTEGRFMQFLEGPETNIRLVFERIWKDRRNQGILLLQEGTAVNRSFPDWTMGFKRPQANNGELWEGYISLNQKSILKNAPFESGSPLNFLQSFYETNEENG